MFLDNLVAAQKRGEARGIASICSAHPWVLRAAIKIHRVGATRHTLAYESPGKERMPDKVLYGLEGSPLHQPLLIEATCNQVNQFGGYTGMTPADFVRYVHTLAVESGFPDELIILGGDHLGPSVWQNEPEVVAMRKSTAMVADFVRAGFAKIHLDASMKLADDPPGPLPVDISARRAAELAQTAEAAHAGLESPAPRYVIGTEVPIPGGAQAHEEGVAVTDVASVQETITITRQAFFRLGLQAAWERVVAIVVQPGVEYGSDFVVDYQPEKAARLSHFIESEPHLVYEAHSTDYQPPTALSNLVRDHFAILKVGPALTFAFREAVFALAMIENELVPDAERSRLIDVLEAAMLADPRHWQKHYLGNEHTQSLARKFSFSDRSRYYWPIPAVRAAQARLLANLSTHPLPLTLVSQFLPLEFEQIRSGLIANHPQAMIEAKIGAVLDDYRAASQ
jgi:D-tagatose-1,6-bisphosphate aldolase subunit GatZ/KbaZ